MPANFTSGWLGNGERAWHGQGVVTEGTLPAREAFETADALFTVEKRELQYPTDTTFDQIEQLQVHLQSGVFGVVRTDTQALLGVVSKQYEIVQNDSLLRMAEFIREEVDMDCVIVLSDGARFVLPPHSVVRRRTSSLETPSNVGSSDTSDMTARLVVVPSSPTSVLSVKTH